MIDLYTKKISDYFKSLSIPHTEIAIRKNVTEWFRSKSKLIELLRKNPEWREDKLAVVTGIAEKREMDSSDYYNNCHHMHDLYLDNPEITVNLTRAVRDNFGEQSLPCSFNRYFSYSTNNNSVYSYMVDYCFCETINEGVADYLNAIAPDFKFRAGMKSTRVLNKIFQYFGFDKHPDYNRIFAKISDALSPKSVKRTAVLSVNPMDYITMSNGNSWSNCMCLIPSRNFDGFEYQGKHKAGCMSYLTDSSSLIFYTLDAECYSQPELWSIPKITRQVIFYSSPHIIHERIYPKSVEYMERDTNPYFIYRNCVQKIIADCEGVSNTWNPSSTIIRENPDTFMYPDWCYYTALRYQNPNLEKGSNTISVGGKTYCIECGSQRFRTTSDINDRMCGTLLCENCCTESDDCDRDDDDDDYDSDDDQYNDDEY